EQVVAGNGEQPASLPSSDTIDAPRQLGHPAVANVDRLWLQTGQGSGDVRVGALCRVGKPADLEQAPALVDGGIAASDRIRAAPWQRVAVRARLSESPAPL